MGFRSIKAGLAALALAVCAVTPAAAQVPDPYARQLAHQLAEVDQSQNRYGFSRAAGPFAGGLAQGQGRRFVLTLRAGQPYRVVGVCDSRCGDLDLRLFDRDGELITQDLAPDRTPMLDINPRATGGYAIEASVAQCADAPCYFAFNVYAR